jgi:trans-aconitate 2-methyltransferase
MSKWDAGQYLKFADARTRPCRELAERIAVDSPRRVIDLGCGPANSTAVLSSRWPDAQIEGIDSSPEMIDAARKSGVRATFTVSDIAGWTNHDHEPYDVIFSNAAMQWVDNHLLILQQHVAMLRDGGAMAMQVPFNMDAPAQQALGELEDEGWRSRFTKPPVRWKVETVHAYYDALAPVASVDLWATTYMHIMESPEAIVEWYKGTALRPYLSALTSDADRSEFLAAYLAKMKVGYPIRADGKVLFPFRRLFVIAYR